MKETLCAQFRGNGVLVGGVEECAACGRSETCHLARVNCSRFQVVCQYAALDDSVDLRKLAREQHLDDPAGVVRDAIALRGLVRAEVAKLRPVRQPAAVDIEDARVGRTVVGSDMESDHKPWCRECEAVYWHKEGCRLGAVAP